MPKLCRPRLPAAANNNSWKIPFVMAANHVHWQFITPAATGVE
jgi:hypothetical protein